MKKTTKLFPNLRKIPNKNTKKQQIKFLKKAKKSNKNKTL